VSGDLGQPRPGITVVAVDTGGTFTDLIGWGPAGVEVLKLPSTPHDPAQAVIEGISRLCPEGMSGLTVLYGTTVATNAVLERRGAKTALLTTAGFEDVLELARQDRPDIYALQPRRPEPLVPADRRLGVAERLGPNGQVEQALSRTAAVEAARSVLATGAESVAVCLLHSYANGGHERALRDALRSNGFAGPVALSSEVLPEYREYERTATTVVQAYVAPIVDDHLGRLEAALQGAQLLVTQSNGGVLSAAEARAQAVRTVLSGPAGGVVGAAAIAQAAGLPDIVTLDMGGTSTDVAVHQGVPVLTTEADVGGVPVRIPTLDIHTVGAGGGSIARQDAGGALVVGPESAGARPGPACYGRGGVQPTVTDAHLVLGRLLPDQFLGGQMHLDPAAAVAALTPLAESLGLSLEATAVGVLRVADATMQRAIKVITLERGHDPRAHTLVSFGGAGGLHAAALADSLGMRAVLAPAHAGLLSAYGFLQSDAVRDVSRALLITLPPGVAFRPTDIPRVDEAFAEMRVETTATLKSMGFPMDRIRLERSLDLRYQGQSFELTVSADSDAINSFHEAHAARYGYRHSHRPLELVTARMRAVGMRDKPAITHASGRGGRPPADAILSASHEAWWPDQAGKPSLKTSLKPSLAVTRVYARARLRPGNRISGPALICEYSATTAVPPGWRARVDSLGGLLLRRPGAA
jgi:N-methylhydantoinase A